MKKRCLIIAGGEWNPSFASSYIQDKYNGKRPELIITADKGLERIAGLQMLPDIMLGDYDSISPEVLADYEKQKGILNLKFPPEKDYTDLHLAIETAIEHGATELCVMGATGTRLDHVLANMGLLKLCLEQHVQAELVDAHNRIRMIDRELTIRREELFGTYISLMPYTERVEGITLTGFQYPLENGVFTLGISRGVSNELAEEQGVIRIQSGLLFVIESRD